MSWPIRSILILHSGALGDTVLQLRMAQVLKRALGEVGITWLGRDCWLPIVRRCASIDRLVGLDAMRAHRLFEEGELTDADLADWLATFDLILNSLAPAGSPAEARLKRFARQAAITYDTKPQTSSTEHITCQWLEQITSQMDEPPEVAAMMQCAGQQVLDGGEILVERAAEDAAEAAELLAGAGFDTTSGNGLVLLHPGSGARSKCWPIENYVRLIEMLAERCVDTAMIVGPVEIEQLGGKIESLRPQYRLLVDPPLSALMGSIGTAEVYVGNDSGPTHLAAAMGVPTIAIFGPTDPRVWRPIVPNVAVLQSQEYEAGWRDVTAETVCLAICHDS